MKALVWLTVCFLSAASVSGQNGPPATKRIPVTETIHGVKITDPYRWLENQTSPETRKWIAAQNRYSDGLLKKQPSRGHIKKRLTQMLKIESTGVPFLRGSRMFYSKQRPR